MPADSAARLQDAQTRQRRIRPQRPFARNRDTERLDAANRQAEFAQQSRQRHRNLLSDDVEFADRDLQRPTFKGNANAIERRLANEERKLQQQLDVAQRLRDLAGRSGNPNLLNTAERMEQTALSRFEQQMQKLVLPEPVGPTLELPSPPIAE